MLTDAGLRLNLGSGEDRREGYVNVDLRPEVADDLGPCDDLSRYADESVAEILALDILEHFPASRTTDVLREWRRVLVPSGQLTVRVPNMTALCRMVAEGDHTALAIRNIYGGHRWGPDGAWDAHHTGWTPDMLVVDLRRAGFTAESNDNALNMTVVARKRGAR